MAGVLRVWNMQCIQWGGNELANTIEGMPGSLVGKEGSLSSLGFRSHEMRFGADGGYLGVLSSWRSLEMIITAALATNSYVAQRRK